MKTIKRRAFTLMELLVVISIIALLMSIMMPALGKAKELARKVLCAANAKQLAMSFNLYSMSYDGYLVPDRGLRPSGYLPGAEGAQPWDSKMAALWDSKKDDAYKKYLICPSDKKKRLPDPNPIYDPYRKSPDDFAIRSYGPNYSLYNNLWPSSINSGSYLWAASGNQTMIPAKSSNVFRPGETILIGENHVGAGQSYPNSPYGNQQGNNWHEVFTKPSVHTATRGNNIPYCLESDTTLHKDGGNYAFVDGSVSWHGLVPGEDFLTGQPYRDLTWPNNWVWGKDKKGNR